MDAITVTVEGAKKALGLGHTKIYEMMERGQLQSIKVGRRRLIRVDSIRALVDQAA